MSVFLGRDRVGVTAAAPVGDISLGIENASVGQVPVVGSVDQNRRPESWVPGNKQDTLVSGTNIKTVNGESVLGAGNLQIPGLPAVTAADNGKVATVVNGAWAAAVLPLYDGGVSYGNP